MNSGGHDGVTRAVFLDKADKQIDSYNPKAKDFSGTTHEIGKNETLIGVNGVEDKLNFYTSFGYIVLTKLF